MAIRPAEAGSRGPGVCLVSAPAGVGKTHGALEFARAHPQLRVHVAFGMKATRDEFRALGLMENWVHVEGRTPENCAEYARAEALGRRSYSVTFSLCAHCTARQDCPYLAAWAAVGSANASFTHQLLLERGTWAADILFVDEDPTRNVFLTEKRITLSMLQSEARRVDREIGYRRVARDPLRALLGALAAVLEELEEGYGTDIHDALDRRLSPGLLATCRGLWDRYGSQIRRIPVVSNAAERSVSELQRLPKPFFLHLLETMVVEMVRMTENSSLTNSKLSIGKDSRGRPCYVLMIHRTISDLTEGVQRLPRIVILDAASTAVYYEPILGVPIREVFSPEVALPREVQVWQVTTALEGKIGLETNPNARSAAIAKIDLLRAITNTYGRKTALITFKSIEEEMAEAIGADRSLHFYGLRGIGELESEGIEVLIVLGTPSIPPDQVLREAMAIHPDGPPIERVSHKMDKVWQPVDPRVREMLYASREREAYQGVYRCRPLSSSEKPKVIIIFSPLQIPHVRPTHIVHALPNVRTMRAFTRILQVVRRLEAEGEKITINKVARQAGSNWETTRRLIQAIRGQGTSS